jgi:hypothetical protein
MNWEALGKTLGVMFWVWTVGLFLWVFHLDRLYRRMHRSWNRLLDQSAFLSHYPASARLCDRCKEVADHILTDMDLYRVSVWSPAYWVLHWRRDYGISEVERAVVTELGEEGRR